MVFFSALLWIVSLMLLMFVHESGHRLAMKRNGVRVLEFTVGSGPWTLWQKRLKDGSVFKLKPFIFVSYTKPAAYGPGSMYAISPWAQTRILLAGPLVNIMASALLFASIVLIGGSSLFQARELLHWNPSYSWYLDAAIPTSFWLILIVKQFALLNFTVGAFNLLPVPWFDGGKIAKIWLRRFRLA